MVLATALNSTLVEKRAMMGCFFKDQNTRLSPKNTKKLLVEQR